MALDSSDEEGDQARKLKEKKAKEGQPQPSKAVLEAEAKARARAKELQAKADPAQQKLDRDAKAKLQNTIETSKAKDRNRRAVQKVKPKHVKASLKLPDQLAQVASQPPGQQQWFLLFVDPKLDWVKQLEKAKIKTGPSPVVEAANGDKKSFVAKKMENQGLYMPVQPVPGHPNHCRVSRGFEGAFTIMAGTKLLQDTEKKSQRLVQKEEATIRKRKATQALEKAQQCMRKQAGRQRMKIPPLKEILAKIVPGNDMGLFDSWIAQDEWSGEGANPFAAEGSDDEGTLGDSQKGERGEELIIWPCSRQRKEGCVAPVMKWQLVRDMDEKRKKKVVIRHFEMQANGKRLASTFQAVRKGSQKMLLQGVKMLRQDAQQYRWLLGAKVVGSRKLWVCEATLYGMKKIRPVGRQRDLLLGASRGSASKKFGKKTAAGDRAEAKLLRQKEKEEAENAPSDFEDENDVAAGKRDDAMYRVARNRATDRLGISKRKRVNEKAQQRLQKKDFISLKGTEKSLEEYVKEMSEDYLNRVVEYKTPEERTKKSRRKFLPPFNIFWDRDGAKNYRLIYNYRHTVGDGKDSLSYICPDEVIEASERSLHDRKTAAFISKVGEHPECCWEENEITKRSTFLRVVFGAMGSAGKVRRDQAELKRITMWIEVLYRMVLFCRDDDHRKFQGKYRIDTVEEMTKLPQGSELASHLHMTYCEETAASKNVREFVPKKFLAALCIWAIHCTPELEMDVAERDFVAMDVEMKTEAGAVRAMFDRIGCDIFRVMRPDPDKPMPALTREEEGRGGTQRAMVKLVRSPNFNPERFARINNPGMPSGFGKAKGSRG